MTERAASYRIVDEPEPGQLARWSVDPLWPMLALMLGGTLIGWLWFAFNAFALGSATRWRELALVGASVAVTGAVALGILFGVGAGVLDVRQAAYLAIALPVAKLGFGYAVHLRQTASCELFRYFGGTLRSGWPVLIASFLFGRRLLAQIESPVLRWVLL